MIEPEEQVRARIDAEWLAEGRAIVDREREMERARDSLAWEMGDWLAGHPGERGYGDMTRLAAELGVPVGTVKNRASVARRVDPARRRDDLTWSHHAEIAALEPDEGDAVLAEAALYTWSVDRLRQEMRRRSAEAAAKAEVDRLRAENAALKAEASGPDAARRTIEAARADISAGLDMIEEGYRRILRAIESPDLAAAALAVHGNAARRLAPSLERLINGRVGTGIEALIVSIDAAIATLGGANRNDDGTLTATGDPPDDDGIPAAAGAGP